MSNLMKLGGISVSIIPVGFVRPYSMFTSAELKNSTLMALSGQLKDASRLRELEQELIVRSKNGTLPEGITLAEQVMASADPIPDETSVA